MSRYLIVNLFSDPVKKHHSELVSALKEHFSVQPQKIGAHMTLIPPFECEDILALVRYTELYAKTHKRMPVIVGGIGSFRDNVVYLKIQMTQEAEQTLIQYIEKAQTHFESRAQLTTPHVFHCTLVSRRISKKFDMISNYLENEQKLFNSYIDNLTLLRWSEDEQQWIVEKQYHLHP
ncbi:2'-5' RNA ligase family protein [Fusibacter ferrireducens]|uniref:2'-5' RNA ligase family protein n=1 Tax=Fusibacter ferrireducens TaxID=2785058 RepID=A0ABR9ZSX0_9FIRM|nr:2'-5' RNA ligase family protein [Fusibacter ferrireducens]MBF4693566.1 2'-5' RNA ligase family protein [Fusibacter ferrireducens]